VARVLSADDRDLQNGYVALAFITSSFLTAGGCSNKKIVGSCELRPAKPRCEDITEAYPGGLAAAKSLCADKQGSWSEVACNRAGILSGCGSDTVIGWEYAGGMSVEQLKEECFGRVFGPDGEPAT
jgi:hypothetical protein